jgi:hypothetical protein
MPIDKGFNRLAWAVPYAVGVAGAMFAGAAAFRWSRRRHDAETPVLESTQAEAWHKKLDEELRDLD